MTNQEVYDKVKAHLLTQNAKCFSRTTRTCMYRMVRSTKRCAIGCLIPDSIYEKGMEGGGVDLLFEYFPKIKEFFNGVGESLLADLQEIHDHTPVKNWPRELENVAKVYDLNP